MRLYVNKCENCGQRIYLNITAYTRSQIRQQFNSNSVYVTCNHCTHRGIYSVSDIFAEANSNTSLTAGIIGGLLGLVAGPAGLVIGGGIGALLGNGSDDEDRKKATFFNNSI